MTSLKFPDGSEVLYELTRKPVKNINLRVKEDGSLRISASPRVSVKRVEEFIISEQAFDDTPRAAAYHRTRGAL